MKPASTPEFGVRRVGHPIGSDASSTLSLELRQGLFGYQGRPVDPETGLVYFRNRYYDPELGRFITADPLGYVDGPSQYIFAMSSPVVFGDRHGTSRDAGGQ